jgi:hypothetical protein
MASKDDEAAKAAARAAKDRREAERRERLTTGKAVKFTPRAGWFATRSKWN